MDLILRPYVKIKSFKQAPLPFVGQKRMGVPFVRRLLTDNPLPQGATVVDTFGGSGLLAHNIRQLRPDLRVIWNDFDDYKKRIDNIAKTERIRKHLSKLLPIQFRTNTAKKRAAKYRLSPEQREQVLSTLRDFEKEDGYLDMITISSWFLFGGKRKQTLTELTKHKGFYMCLPLTPYGEPTGYLSGVERVRLDFRAAMEAYAGEGSGTFYVLDPPYLGTDVSGYKAGFSEEDFCDMLERIQGSGYMIFGSARSEITNRMLHYQEAFPILRDFGYHIFNSIIDNRLQRGGTGKRNLYSNLDEYLFYKFV